MSGYGIKVQTDTGHWVWITKTGTARTKTAAGVLRFESETSADGVCDLWSATNPDASLKVVTF
jgi:hypothetical protein